MKFKKLIDRINPPLAIMLDGDWYPDYVINNIDDEICDGYPELLECHVKNITPKTYTLYGSVILLELSRNK